MCLFIRAFIPTRVRAKMLAHLAAEGAPWRTERRIVAARRRHIMALGDEALLALFLGHGVPTTLVIVDKDSRALVAQRVARLLAAVAHGGTEVAAVFWIRGRVAMRGGPNERGDGYETRWPERPEGESRMPPPADDMAMVMWLAPHLLTAATDVDVVFFSGASRWLLDLLTLFCLLHDRRVRIVAESLPESRIVAAAAWDLADIPVFSLAVVVVAWWLHDGQTPPRSVWETMKRASHSWADTVHRLRVPTAEGGCDGIVFSAIRGHVHYERILGPAGRAAANDGRTSLSMSTDGASPSTSTSRSAWNRVVEHIYRLLYEPTHILPPDLVRSIHAASMTQRLAHSTKRF